MADDNIEGVLISNGRIVAVLNFKDWLESTLKWLREIGKWREEISWNESISHISESWLRNHNFGPPTVQLRALHSALSALVDEDPRTSAPPPEPPVRPRRRGPKAQVLQRVMNHMSEDIKRGNATPKELLDTPEKALEVQYGASRDTCRKARDKVLTTLELSNIKSRQIADK
jgi:hypothetical protein